MVNKTKPFLLIDRRGQNTVYLRYGESGNDPKLFAEAMRTIAISKYERGFATETLL